MKTRSLKNYDSSIGLEVYDIDLNNDEEILELGRLVADQCIVYVNQNISTKRLYDIMIQWGNPSRALTHEYVLNKKLDGRHWRDLLVMLGLVAKNVKDISAATAIVSYRRDEKGKPIGIFADGELDWHSDQCAIDDAPRTIGLQSVSDSADSQTQFLCTHDAYESMSSDMRSMIKELVVRHRWVPGALAPGLSDPAQQLLARYNSVPLDGLETKLYTETATGLTGMKIPSHSFDGFIGMSYVESAKLLKEILKLVYQEKYVYTQDWQDGQIVFMDQEITLHKRPTNITHGSKRTMARVITYLDKLYPQHKPWDTVRFKGKQLTHEEFAHLINEDRKQTFEEFELVATAN
jgi:alpha-ketoglutarate-dependent taurine dioxygenase